MSDGDRTEEIRTVLTDEAPAPAGHYVQATVCNGLVFVSGQLPVRPDGTHAPDVPFEAQTRQAIEVYIRLERHVFAPGMQTQNGSASFCRRQTDGDRAIETTGTLQCRVEIIRTVGGRNDHHAITGREAVHLDQQLVERAIIFVVRAVAAARAT